MIVVVHIFLCESACVLKCTVDMSILSFRLSILHLIQCTGRCACCVLLNAKRKTWYDLTMS